jgi:hypothetical protein
MLISKAVRFANCITRFMFTILMMGAVVASAVAQGPGRGGPGGGRMMMGGGMGGGASQLLMMKEVREELNLDEDQIKELEDMGKAMMESFASMRPAQGQAPDPKMMQEAMEKIRKATAEAEEKLTEILDPNQTERLIGLIIQRDSIRAINSKMVADKLGITAEQKEKMASMEKENMDKMREMFQGGGGGGGFGPEMREKMRAFREESEAKMKDILTAAQKEQMESLKGAEFKFPEPQWGGGRGGPGRGGPGGAGGGRGGRGGGDGNN